MAPDGGVASAGCPELLDVDLTVLIEVSLADDVMVPAAVVVDLIVDVIIPPPAADEGGAGVCSTDTEDGVGVGVGESNEAMLGQTSLQNVGGEREREKETSRHSLVGSGVNLDVSNEKTLPLPLPLPLLSYVRVAVYSE